jgi:hypothetical protein
MKLVVSAIVSGLVLFGADAFAGDPAGRAIKPTRQVIEECIHRQKAADVSKVAMLKNCRQELKQQRTLESRREPAPVDLPRG